MEQQNPTQVPSQTTNGADNALSNHPLIKYSDMEEEIRTEAVEAVVNAIERYPHNYENASRMIKDNMDKKAGSGWHVIIGEGYGFKIDHELNSLLYLFFGKVGILLFKCM